MTAGRFSKTYPSGTKVIVRSRSDGRVVVEITPPTKVRVDRRHKNNQNRD